MTSRSHRPAEPVRSAKVGRRQAQQARTELAAAGLSHHDERRLRAVLRSREDAARQRRLWLKHLGIAVTGAVVAAAITALSFGLVPAIEAARGQGVIGSFVVSERVCSSKVGCQWVGTFRSSQGVVISGLAYGGTLPAGDGPGSVIPARYPGGTDQVYAQHGSHTWLIDLLVTVVVGAAVGTALWISPLGGGGRNPAGVRASG
ncbi:MAG TPA: hypothetical protein VEJ42_02905 [Streptosporangiaceae bacterium]|nr:hypothetical protein [Streptosporangiaceae bacterium]